MADEIKNVEVEVNPEAKAEEAPAEAPAEEAPAAEETADAE